MRPTLVLAAAVLALATQGAAQEVAPPADPFPCLPPEAVSASGDAGPQVKNEKAQEKQGSGVKEELGAAVGGTVGQTAGAAVAGPIGAAVGGVLLGRIGQAMAGGGKKQKAEQQASAEPTPQASEGEGSQGQAATAEVCVPDSERVNAPA